MSLRDTGQKLYPLSCGSGWSPVLSVCPYLWSNQDWQMTPPVNYPSSQIKTPCTLRIQDIQSMCYYRKQQPAFEHLPLCAHHCTLAQTYNSAPVPTCLLGELIQEAVWIWRVKIWRWKSRGHIFFSCSCGHIVVHVFSNIKSRQLHHLSFLKWPIWGHIFMSLSL